MNSHYLGFLLTITFYLFYICILVNVTILTHMIRKDDFKFCVSRFSKFTFLQSLCVQKEHYSENHNSSHPCLTLEADFQKLGHS